MRRQDQTDIEPVSWASFWRNLSPSSIFTLWGSNEVHHLLGTVFMLSSLFPSTCKLSQKMNPILWRAPWAEIHCEVSRWVQQITFQCKCRHGTKRRCQMANWLVDLNNNWNAWINKLKYRHQHNSKWYLVCTLHLKNLIWPWVHR